MRMKSLVCVLMVGALAGCKTTSSSSSPSVSMPVPTSSSSSSSSSSSGSSGSSSPASSPKPKSGGQSGASGGTTGSSPSIPAGGGMPPGSGSAGGGDRVKSGGSDSSGQQADRTQMPPKKPGAGSGGTSEGKDGDGDADKASDEVSLEESKAAATAGGDGSESGSAASEDAVLDAAIAAMKRQSEPTLDDASASAGSDAASGGTAEDAAGGGGTGSEAAQLNAELDASLARFDGALLDEQARKKAEAEAEGGDSGSREETVALLDEAVGEGDEAGEPSYGSAEAGRAAGEAGGDGGGTGTGTAPTIGDQSSGGGVSPGGARGRKGDFTHTTARNTVPADIPDGSDDDVVARQIREAAMKEQDPELRARLWDEYRKYVDSTKRKG